MYATLTLIDWRGATRAAAAIEVADRNSRNASLTLAFALPGDTLLLPASP